MKFKARFINGNFLWVNYAALFLRSNKIAMEVQKKSKGMYWVLFLISTASLLIAIAGHCPYLTLIIPFVTLFFVKAMDII